MNKVLLAKLAVIGLGVMPTAWSQEGGLDPQRLGLDEAKPGGDVKLTTEGQVLPGDLGRQLSIDLSTAQETPEEAEAKQIAQLPQSVQALGDAQKREIVRLLGEAATFIQGIRLQEGLDRLIQIEAISKEIYQTYNLRGAIFTKLRDFEKAREGFRKALQLRPGLMEAIFNLAELDFVEKKFPEAERAFRKMKADMPDLALETVKLIDYKLFISVLLQSSAPGDSKEKQALAMLETFDYLDDYPVYYFSQAALAFHRDQKEEAEEWLSSSRRIYDKATHTIYVDALIEMGWVNSL